MAITINQEPDDLTPIYNPMEFHVTSTNTAQDNFKFICDIYVNGSIITPRLKRSKHPDYNACVFDIHRIVETYVTQTLEALFPEAGSNLIDDNWVSVQCKFGEEYGDSSSGVTVYPDLATSSTIYAFNGSVNYDEFVDWVGANYLMDSSGSTFLQTFPTKTVPFATTGTRGNNILRNQDYHLFAHTLDTPAIDRLVIVTYDEDQSLIDEYQIEQIRISPKFLMFPAGYNVNDVDAGNFVTGTPPVYTDDVKYAKIYLVDASNNQLSEEIWLQVLDNCSPYDQYEIHWIDRLGATNTYIFDHSHTENININRKEYKKQAGTMASTSFTYSKADRGYENYFTSSNSELTLRSGWITENEYNWLMYLKESPQVWIKQNGEFISVNVTDTSYEVKQTVNRNLINMELKLKFSVANYKQRY